MFEYDLWANRLWRAALAEKGWPEPDREVFTHILNVQQIWLARVYGTSPTEIPDIEPTEQNLEALTKGWNKALTEFPSDPETYYRRLNGDDASGRLSLIAQHVVLHGTYHRGELRGLCLAGNEEHFPETDFSLFMNMKPIGHGPIAVVSTPGATERP